MTEQLRPAAEPQQPAQGGAQPTPRQKKWDKFKIMQIAVTLLPIVALALLLGVYIALISVRGYNMGRMLENIINQGIVLAIVATGAIFIFTLGSFDISLGASVLFSATVGVLAYNATGNVFVLFLVCVAVAVACSLVSSALASVFRLPMFVTTVAMLSVLTAIATTIISTNSNMVGGNPTIGVTGSLQGALDALDELWFRVLILAIFMVLCLFLYNFTKVGRRQKFLGGNPICAKMTGISGNKYSIIAFCMAGLGVGLGAFLTIIYTPSVSTGTAGDIGMSVFIAIVFGGMPISGGARSRIYAALVGGFSYILLDNILTLLFESVQGARDGISQIISAVLFLAVVWVASTNYRTKLLPR